MDLVGIIADRSTDFEQDCGVPATVAMLTRGDWARAGGPATVLGMRVVIADGVRPGRVLFAGPTRCGTMEARRSYSLSDIEEVYLVS